MTEAELIQAAEKSGGADENMRLAAEQRHSNEQAVRAWELMGQARNEAVPIDQRIQAMNELQVMTGQPPLDAQTIAQIKAASQPAPAAQPGAGQQAAPPPAPVTMENLPPEVRRAVEQTQLRDAQEAREKIFQVIDNSLDTDPVLGKIVDKDERARLSKLARREVQRRVVIEREEFKPELVVEVLQELRPYARQPKPANDSPQDDLATILAAGGLPSIGGGAAEALGGYAGAPSAGPVAGASPNRPAGQPGGERFSISDPRWTQSFMESIRRNMAAGLRK